MALFYCFLKQKSVKRDKIFISTGIIMAQILDGKAFAKDLRHHIAIEVDLQKNIHTLTPALAVIIVGEDPASHVYVNNKEKAALETGIKSVIHRLPENTSQDDLETLISSLNDDKDIHGILVQMPLPKHLNEAKIIEKIDALKDVDGFHTVNTGLLHGDSPRSGLMPCTPSGCMLLLETLHKDLSGLNAVVVGRSHIVGRPVAEMLLQRNATVTIAHSRTKDLETVVKNADIIVAAVGRPEMIQGEWIKKDAIILDVGINRIQRDGKNKLVGDVAFESAKEKASAITPVPGGIGPMTIACLLQNTVFACYLQNNLLDDYEKFKKSPIRKAI